MIQTGLEFTVEFRLALNMNSLACRRQKKGICPAGTEVKATMWVLKIKHRSSGKTASSCQSKNWLQAAWLPGLGRSHTFYLENLGHFNVQANSASMPSLQAGIQV